MPIRWNSIQPAFLGLSWDMSLSRCLHHVSDSVVDSTSSYIRLPFVLTKPHQELLLYFNNDGIFLRTSLMLWESHAWNEKRAFTDSEMDYFFHQCHDTYTSFQETITGVFGQPHFSGTLGDPGYMETGGGGDHVTCWNVENEQFMLEWTFYERHDPLTIDFSCRPCA
jgi:hypothetical protein